MGIVRAGMSQSCFSWMPFDTNMANWAVVILSQSCFSWMPLMGGNLVSYD
jgi:hypothetical protein